MYYSHFFRSHFEILGGLDGLWDRRLISFSKFDILCKNCVVILICMYDVREVFLYMSILIDERSEVRR